MDPEGPSGSNSQAAATPDDLDCDSIPNSSDNCSQFFNPKQRDGDNDRYGNACDGDFNNDGVADSANQSPLQAHSVTPLPSATTCKMASLPKATWPTSTPVC